MCQLNLRDFEGNTISQVHRRQEILGDIVCYLKPVFYQHKYYLCTLPGNANILESRGCWIITRDPSDLSIRVHVAKFVLHSNGLLDAMNGW